MHVICRLMLNPIQLSALSTISTHSFIQRRRGHTASHSNWHIRCGYVLLNQVWMVLKFTLGVGESSVKCGKV